MRTNTIKVLIADDSGFIQLLIKSILRKDKQITVVGNAYNGIEAIEQTEKHRPNVVLMDMVMPIFDGHYGIKGIMEKCPTPIVILSGLGEQNMSLILDAIKLGAVDYLNKPDGDKSSLRLLETQIISKIQIASKIDAQKLLNPTIESINLPHVFSAKRQYDIIVIGASTGGPSALEKILRRIPQNLPIPILIAQHMPKDFIESFAKRLKQTIPIPIHVAKTNDEVLNGHIYIAPGNTNTIIRKNRVNGKIIFDEDNSIYKEFNNPSINALMNSVAQVYAERSIAVILTGMGTDGIKGMENIYLKGGYTIAQDKESSVVFGMPKEAISKAIVNNVISIDEMGEFLVSCL